MNVKNCRKCGKVFNSVFGARICPACNEAAEQKFSEVRDYVRDHKGVSIRTVSQECDVEEQQIRQWVKEERLILDTESGIGVFCERCGVAIPSGRLCVSCKNDLINGFNPTKAAPEHQQTQAKATHDNKMRFINN